MVSFLLCNCWSLSPEFSSGYLYRSLGFFLYAAISSLMFWLANTSHLGLLKVSALFQQGIGWNPLGFPHSVPQPGNSLKNIILVNPKAHLIHSHLSWIIGLCCLISSVWTVIISNMFSAFLGCFSWEGKSSPCYFILAKNRNSPAIKYLRLTRTFPVFRS